MAYPVAGIVLEQETCGLDLFSRMDMQEIKVLCDFFNPVINILLRVTREGGDFNILEEACRDAGRDVVGHDLRGIL